MLQQALFQTIQKGMGESESRLGGLGNMSSKKRPEGGESMGNDLFSLYIFLSEGTDTCESLELGKKQDVGENFKMYVCLEYRLSGRARYRWGSFLGRVAGPRAL